MSTTAADWLARLRPRRETLLWGAVVLNAELLLVLAYLRVADVTPTAVRYYAYPFVWINVGLWALVRTDLPDAGRRWRWTAGAITAGYLLVLAYAGGVVAPGHGLVGHTGHPHPTGVRVALLPPGWGPALLYQGPLVGLNLLPFKVVGYAALAYLVYATVLDTARSAIGGVVGLFSCVSCTLPVIAGVLGGFVGSAAVASAAFAQSYGLSTLAFVVTVALLYWRPLR